MLNREEMGENEPIILSELNIEGVSNNTLRQKVKKLTDEGFLKRYDIGDLKSYEEAGRTIIKYEMQIVFFPRIGYTVYIDGVAAFLFGKERVYNERKNSTWYRIVCRDARKKILLCR